MEKIEQHSFHSVLSKIESLEQLELVPPTQTSLEEVEKIQPIFKDVPSNEYVVTQTLLELLEKELSNTKSISLTSDEVELLKLVMTNLPSSFKDIEKCINEIISDNTINASDLPKFLTLIKDFYLIIQSVNANNTSLTGQQLVTISANIIKFIVPIILKKIDLDNPSIIQMMNSITDTATTLLLFVPEVKNGKCRLFCF